MVISEFTPADLFYPSQVLRKHAPFGAVWTQFNSAVVDHFLGW